MDRQAWRQSPHHLASAGRREGDPGGRTAKHNDAHIEEKVRELDGLIAWAVEREAQKEQKQNQANNDVVARFNAQYAVVKYIGKAFIFESQYDDILQRRVLVKITFADFRKFYQNRYIMIRDDVTTEAEHWLSSPHRRQYLGGVVFDPKGKARPDQWNLWNGFEFEPKAGDWSLMCNHIRDVICGGDKAALDYVLNWTALMFKKPDKPDGVALVLRGLKGVGKGIFFHYLRKACGIARSVRGERQTPHRQFQCALARLRVPVRRRGVLRRRSPAPRAY